MHPSNREIKRIARAQLSGQYRLPVLAELLVALLPALVLLPFSYLLTNTASLVQNIIYDLAYLIVLILTAVLGAGRMYLQLNLARRKPFALSDLLRCFKVRPDTYILAFLLYVVYALPYLAARIGFGILSIYVPAFQGAPWPLISFLIKLLLLIATIAILLRYAMVFPLLLDQPDQKIRAAFQESRRLMDGQCKRFLLLLLSFLGYALLGLMSLGVGFLWINPYLVQSVIVFYQDLTGELSSAENESSSVQSSFAQP
ncbi:MAG: DUF975 family protein [Lachnospiraceae bacterium]|nr:DUF975 family protein [Lachnospiraceae bacterium]